MIIVVCTRFGNDDPERKMTGWWDLAVQQGHKVYFVNEDWRSVPVPDALVCMSVSQQEQAWSASARHPNAALYCYQWDTYSWVWTNPRPDECYDWHRWGNLLRKCRRVWVPSVCTETQAKLWWGPSLDCEIILSGTNLWEPTDVKDGGFAYCPLRRIPDRWRDQFTVSCHRLGIPFIHSDHNLPVEEYRRNIEQCRFLVNHFWEASTGGLSQLEAFAVGKPILAHNSPWNGAADYLGGVDGFYQFNAGSVRDFERRLTLMYSNPKVLNNEKVALGRHWIKEQYGYPRMMRDMLRSIESSANI